MRSPGRAALHVTGPAINLCGHDAAGATVHKRLAKVALIEDYRSVDRRDAALVTSVLDSFSHAFEYTARVEQPRRNRSLEIGWSKTEDVCVEDQTGTHSSTEWISVHTNYAGERAAVRVQSRRRVVGLHLDHQVPLLVKADHPALSLNTERQKSFFPSSARIFSVDA